MEIPTFIWSVLYYFGWFAGLYVFSAIVFVVCARLEKDQDGSLLVDLESLHYRACRKCYEWREHAVRHSVRHSIIDDYIKIDHIEYYQMGVCGYFWRVFWAFILLPVGYTILGTWQTLKTVVYAPFMFLFGYYPWPTVNVMKRNDNIFAVEMERISFPQVGKWELKPYLVILPVLYGWLF